MSVEKNIIEEATFKQELLDHREAAKFTQGMCTCKLGFDLSALNHHWVQTYTTDVYEYGNLENEKAQFLEMQCHDCNQYWVEV
jgi:hypothetical protein